MYYVLIFIFILIIIRGRNSTNVNKKTQRLVNILLILCGLVAVGIVVYSYFSINH